MTGETFLSHYAGEGHPFSMCYAGLIDSPYLMNDSDFITLRSPSICNDQRLMYTNTKILMPSRLKESGQHRWTVARVAVKLSKDAGCVDARLSLCSRSETRSRLLTKRPDQSQPTR